MLWSSEYRAEARSAYAQCIAALLKQAEAIRSPAPAAAIRTCKAAPVLRWVILAVAVVFLIWGYCIGGTADVLTKAINICTECVGLG